MIDKFFALFRQDFRQSLPKFVLALFVLFAFLVSFVENFSEVRFQQFVHLADSFTQGYLYFMDIPGSLIDLAPHEGKFYWHLGPFPAIILTPFVLIFGEGFLQGYVNFFLTVINFYLLYKIALKLGIKRNIDAAWLAFAYLFSTMYIKTAFVSYSWHFAHAVVTTLILYAIFEYLHKKRFWIMGLCMAFALATRANLIVALPFFIMGILSGEKFILREKLISFLRFMSPIFIVGLILLLYNFARFGDFFDNGYEAVNYFDARIGISEPVTSYEYSGKFFSLSHIPTNLYYYFFKGLNPILVSPDSHFIKPPFMLSDNWGFSLLISAPILLFALLADSKEKLVRQSWIAAGLIFFTLLLYYQPNFSSGYAFSQRYFLDLMPFLFILLVRGLAPGISFPMKVFIAISFIANVFLVLITSLPYPYLS